MTRYSGKYEYEQKRIYWEIVDELDMIRFCVSGNVVYSPNEHQIVRKLVIDQRMDWGTIFSDKPIELGLIGLIPCSSK